MNPFAMSVCADSAASRAVALRGRRRMRERVRCPRVRIHIPLRQRRQIDKREGGAMNLRHADPSAIAESRGSSMGTASARTARVEDMVKRRNAGADAVGA